MSHSKMVATRRKRQKGKKEIARTGKRTKKLKQGEPRAAGHDSGDAAPGRS